MSSRRKINLEKVRASLFTLCTECGYKIQSGEWRRIDGERLRCPKCGAAFIPAKKVNKGYWPVRIPEAALASAVTRRAAASIARTSRSRVGPSPQDRCTCDGPKPRQNSG